MLPVYLFVIAIVFALFHILVKRQWKKTVEILLSYLIFFNIGIMGLAAFYAHIFMSDITAQNIGWPPGSPFQWEIGVANLSYGILGVLALRYRDLFWLATVLGYSILLLGAFVVHLVEYSKGDLAPYNTGIFLWFGDFTLPLICLFLLYFYMRDCKE